MTQSSGDSPPTQPTVSAARSERIGVYFMASDGIYEWTIGFLESFRHFNPDLRLIMIPFDNNSERVRQLLPRYNAEVLDSPAFDELERIGSLIFQKDISEQKKKYRYYQFHRFAAFWGPLDEFLYLDGRILVLSDLRPMIEAPRRAGYDLVHYDCVMDAVYLPGPLRYRLIKEKHARGFLATLFATRKDLFSLEELTRHAEEARADLDGFHPGNSDQVFIDYICDTNGIKYAGFFETDGYLVLDCWAWFRGVYRGAGNIYYRWQHGGREHNKRVPLLHWAGIRLGPVMPEALLWLKFRLKSEPPLKRIAWTIKWRLARVVLKFVEVFQRNRHVSNAYHLLRNRISGRPLPEGLAVTLGLTEVDGVVQR